MQKLNSKRSNYRQYIQRRCGNIHRTESNDKHHKKNWKKNLTILRENIIDQYQYNMKKPRYMVTRTYYYYEPDRNKILKHNDRVNRVIDDLFNPRGYDEYHVNKDHFIERHRPTLVGIVRTKSEPSTKSMHMRTKIGTSRKVDFIIIYYYPI